jgi:hypothetical protein
MFHSPIGGISFLSNILIIFFGVMFSLFRKSGPNKRYLVTQENISSFESTTLGIICSRGLAMILPLGIFLIVSLLCVSALVRLYNDEDKISLFDVLQKGVSGGLSGVAMTEAYVLKYTTNHAIALQSKGADGHIMQNSASLEGLPASPSLVVTLNDSDRVFTKGVQAVTLNEFLEANNLDSSFESRHEFAVYLGIHNYQGTRKQNRELLDRLLEMTYADLRAYLEN